MTPLSMITQAPHKQHRRWRTRGVVSQVIRLLRTNWLVLVVALAIVPGIWTISLNILEGVFKPPKALPHDFERIRLDMLHSLAVTAWNSIWEAGGLCIAIAVARSSQVRLRCLLTGVVYSPAVFMIGVVTSLPFDLAQILSLPSSELSPMVFGASLAGFLPSSELSPMVLSLGATLVGFYLATRTVFWLPLIVDAEIPFWHAVLPAWGATRNLVMSILSVGFLFALGLIPLGVLDYAVGDKHLYVTMALGNMLRVMVVAVFYVATWDDYLQKMRAGDTHSTTTNTTSQQS